MNGGIFDLDIADEANSLFFRNIFLEKTVFDGLPKEAQLNEITNKRKYCGYHDIDLTIEDSLNVGYAYWKYHFWASNYGNKYDDPKYTSLQVSIAKECIYEFEKLSLKHKDERLDVGFCAMLDFILAGVYVGDRDEWKTLKDKIEETDLAERIRNY